MAARLEWTNGNDLVLGKKWVLATILKERGQWRMLLIAHKGALPCEKDLYERLGDCKTDCMREVRRLLKEAGCEVMP